MGRAHRGFKLVPPQSSGAVPVIPSKCRWTAALPRTPTLGDDAEKMADVLQVAIPTLRSRIKMTEDNDENQLFGRPGQYDQGSFLGDSRLDCDASTDFNDLDTACGVKIERWPSQDAALARAKDIQQKLQDFGLRAEWDYVVGRLVVSASGDYKPSQAEEIQNASTAGDAVGPSD